MDQISWTEMTDGTREDYEFLGELYEQHARETLTENSLTILNMLAGPKLGYQIDRYQHSLQSATRALRNNERIDLVVGALLHDIGDAFAPHNHSDAAASLLAPYLDEEAVWVVKHHGLFQGYYYFHHHDGDPNAREMYSDSPYYDACVDFCAEYDQNCFDPKYDTLPVEEFVPMLNEVFARESKIPGIAPLPA